METTTIQQLFQEFIDNGGEPKVTSFKRHIDQLINSDIKHLCGRSAKTGLVNDWRSEVKERFGGRGAKWVKVTLEEIKSTLDGYDDEANNYREWVTQAGYAWIRFTGPRVANGMNCAAFEVRIFGSRLDHPKNLHYIPVQQLDEKIQPLGSTPFAMKLEEEATTPVVEDEASVAIEVASEEVVEVDEPYEDMMGDIDELMDMEDDLDF